MDELEKQLIRDNALGEQEDNKFYRAWLINETLQELGPAFPYVLTAILLSPIVIGLLIGWLTN